MSRQNSQIWRRTFTSVFSAAIFLLVQHASAAPALYVGNNSASGGIKAYVLPITGASTPGFVIAGSGIVSIGLDPAGNLLAGVFPNQFAYYPAPLSSASAPSATFTITGANSVGQIVFTPSGDVWIGSGNSRAYRFSPPFSNASVPAQTLLPPGATGIFGVAFDSATNLYLADTNRVFVYAPPYSGAPIITTAVSGAAYRKIIISGSQLFVGNVGATPNGAVEVYSLPLTTASVPAFEIANGMYYPEALAFDASGNLYAGNLGSGNVTVYNPPFSSASAAVTSLNTAYSIFSTAIGPSTLAAPVPAVAVSAPTIGTSRLLALCALMLTAGLLALRIRARR